MTAVSRSMIRSLFLLLVLTLFTTGCYHQKSNLLLSQPFPPLKDKTAVVGFRAALTEGQSVGLVKSPFSGAFFMAAPVEEKSVRHLNDFLFNRLAKKEGYDLISPHQVEEALPGIVYSEKSRLDSIAVIQKIGKAFEVKHVLAGHIYRWKEREGTEYSARDPASVAFELCLIKTENGDILWKGSFDKKQQSLAENILNFRLFFSGKGKWMTASQLAEFGLSEMID